MIPVAPAFALAGLLALLFGMVTVDLWPGPDQARIRLRTKAAVIIPWVVVLSQHPLWTAVL